MGSRKVILYSRSYLFERLELFMRYSLLLLVALVLFQGCNDKLVLISEEYKGLSFGDNEGPGFG